jgi:hypothetical protein
LQRTTSALTAAVLGAALTASTALAWQAPAPDNAPSGRASSTKTKTGPASAAEAANSQLYGMSVTRGARYLLRNGLDYLSYQQYDRALKFLREAEARITDQKSRKVQIELNDAEVTALKQGIETAQRGLRRASNAETPYALSEKSRPANGFTPARPSNLLASRGKQSNAMDRQAKATPVATHNSLPADGDDDRGQPVRLASGERILSDQPSNNTNSPAPGSIDADGPINMPESPQIPLVSRLPDLTVVNGSERLAAGGDQVSSKAQPVVGSSSSDAQRSNSSAPETQGGEQTAPISSLPPLVSPDAIPTTTEHAVEVKAPAVVDQAPGLPISDGNSAAPGAATTAPPVSLNPVSGVLTDSLATPAAVSAATGPAPKSPVIGLETIPSSSPVDDTSQPVDPGGPPHKEAADPLAAPNSTAVSVAPTPNTAAEPAGASPGAGDDLPPLPGDAARVASDVTLTNTATAQPSPADAPITAQLPADDVLPPLPAGADRSTPVPAQSATSPAVSPMPAANDTTSPATTIAEQPAQTNEAGTAQPSTEPLPVLPAGSAAPVSPVDVSPAGSINPNTVPELPTSEVAQQPSLSASVAPNASANPSDPTMNPNLESQPPTAATRAGTEPDVSSLPPALTGQTLKPSTDAFLPDRANPPSTLKPELQREVERIARRQEEEMRRQAQNPTQPANAPRDTMASDLRTQTQMDISRAPSPAEARPIKAIPVPEDWVPLEPRNWSPQRKYWAAAATCHLPLYFQDPVLERYGHSVEQFVGPLGRFLTYPVDDPTQSTQRNQMLQPFFSAGLMGLQIIAWPYNLVMDPPWEAQYDLGYYRPGDNIPTDTYWLPLHGYGPPLRGSNY